MSQCVAGAAIERPLEGVAEAHRGWSEGKAFPFPTKKLPCKSMKTY